MSALISESQSTRGMKEGIPPIVATEEDRYAILRGKRVVIVEDEGITQLQLRKILRRECMEVVDAATNGAAGVAAVLRTRPDIVLMDIRMPIMDGLKAAELILAEFKVCIVMLTAFAEAEYQRQAQELGTCGYIVKPVTVEVLMPQLLASYQRFSSGGIQT